MPEGARASPMGEHETVGRATRSRHDRPTKSVACVINGDAGDVRPDAQRRRGTTRAVAQTLGHVGRRAQPELGGDRLQRSDDVPNVLVELELEQVGALVDVVA